MIEHETNTHNSTEARLAALQTLGRAAITENAHSERIPLDSSYEPRLEKGEGMDVVRCKQADGTTLLFEARSTGDPDGWPVFVHHGTGFSAEGPYPRGIALHRLGVRIIGITREGYRDTLPRAGRIIADSATVTEAAAIAYDIKEFSVMGRSTGGLHALACAALLPECVNAGLVSSIAPHQLLTDWTGSMSDVNKKDYATAEEDPAALLMDYTEVAKLSEVRPTALLERIWPSMSASDWDYLGGTTMRRLIAEGHVAGLTGKALALGWLDDVIAAKVLPLGFDPTEIEKPVHLVQGDRDTFTPRNHFEWLKTNIPGVVESKLLKGVGHMGTFDYMPKLFGDLGAEARQIVESRQ